MADKKNLIFPPGFLNYFYFFVFETICVFKPKVYNIVNTLRGERTGCRGMVSPALAVDPTPLPSSPTLFGFPAFGAFTLKLTYDSSAVTL